MSDTANQISRPTVPRVVAYWIGGNPRRGYGQVMPIYPTSVAEWRTRHRSRGYTGDTRMHAIWARWPAVGDEMPVSCATEPHAPHYDEYGSCPGVSTDQPAADAEHGCPHCGRGVAPITGGPMRGRWPRHKDDLPWLTVGWCPGSGQPATDPAVRVLPPVVTEREAARHLRNAHGYGTDELAVIEDALGLHGSTHSALIAPADLGHVHAETGGRARLAVRRAVGATLDGLTGTDT